METRKFPQISGVDWQSHQTASQIETEKQNQTFYVCPRERAFAWVCWNQESQGREQAGQGDILVSGAVMCLTCDHERAPKF